jgi:2-polyprenyl-3-methyl-5-hydroxy-6-metoxy-1,4-benzoquinol methylase
VEAAELTALLRDVRDRVRARNPQTAAGGVPIALSDLMPVVHARDAALGKVAAIGTVNPRRGGLANSLVQAWKRLLARALDWHVREQVEFNRNIVTCIDALIESSTGTNRALVEMGSRLAAAEALNRELLDIREHWTEWKADWERKLAYNEVQFLRNVAELQAAFQHRVTLMENNLRQQIEAQHRDYEGALERANLEIQQRVWAELERVRREYESLIFSELKTIRQRAQVAAAGGTAAAPTPAAAPAAAPAVDIDYGRFAERFRGGEEYVRRGQQFYRPYFQGLHDVLDVGCGRGEFLETMRDLGVPARGIDLDANSIATCRAKGLDAVAADLFEYLAALPPSSLDGIFCSQVVEHLPPERLPEMVKLAATRLNRGGVLAIETPNPECLAIFATHFYLDPTHTRPVPHPLLAFYLEESGMGAIEMHRRSPAVESMPAVASLPEDFRNAFFDGLDYALIARKL